MKYLSLDAFLDIFKTNKELSYSDFIKKSVVKTSKLKIPLSEYINKNKIDIEDIKLLYENIVHRNEYLKRFYNKSLLPKFKDENHLLEFPKPMNYTEINNNALVGYKNIIRNIHYDEILKNTKSGFDNVPTFMDVLMDLFIHNIIDYKILCASSRFYLNKKRLGSVFSSLYFRASIMNPYVVYSLNETLLKGERIFTPTLGWSSYSYGFLASDNVTEYVGNDVIPSVCKKTKEFANTFFPQKMVDIWQQPSENLLKNSIFKQKYKSYFDVVFFSPPYYRLELYSGSDQSTTNYSSYEEWLQGYWKPTIELCNYVLKPKGKLCYIIGNYGKKEQTDLVNDLNNITTLNGFNKDKMLLMHNKNVHVNAKQTNNDENICVFIKKA